MFVQGSMFSIFSKPYLQGYEDFSCILIECAIVFVLSYLSTSLLLDSS